MSVRVSPFRAYAGIMYFIILFLVALAVSAIGFKRFIWFISVGYGYSMAAIGTALLVIFGVLHQLTVVPIILSAFLVVYGIRLGTYIVVRELKSPSYRDVKQKAIQDGERVPFVLRVLVWVAVSFLYVCQTSPILFRLENHTPDNVMGIVGASVMGVGVLLESVADYTKNRFKQQHPDSFCDVGVFKLVRCPNYLGEILVWIGLFVSGITAYANPWQWAAAIFGCLCMVWIMFGGARRLELRQDSHYGSDPAYRFYKSHTPILLPFLPIYSFKRYKWLVG